MMIALRKFGIAALLATAMAAAFAKPWHNAQERQAAPAERQRQWAEMSLARRDEGQNQRQPEQRGDREERQQPQREGYGGNYGQPGQEEGRRGGRMSPEDRRELRRQIDEAGRNIYAPRR